MSEDKYSTDNDQQGDLKVNLSAGNSKIKYYECNNDSYVFEILDNQVYKEENKYEDTDKEQNQEDLNIEQNKIKIEYEDEKENFKNGTIIVKSIIDYGKQELLKGVKINLYKINGLSPILVKSKITNEHGEVIFSNIEEGSYRIIELINKEFFEKPKYINWNEITINCDNKKEKVLIINKLKNKNIGKHN